VTSDGAGGSRPRLVPRPVDRRGGLRWWDGAAWSLYTGPQYAATPGRTGGWRRWVVGSPTAVRLSLLVLWVAGTGAVVSAAVAVVALIRDRPTPGITFLYRHAGAAEQRFAAGILLAFFCVHLAAALGERSRTRKR
jgi:hypothetical protein